MHVLLKVLCYHMFNFRKIIINADCRITKFERKKNFFYHNLKFELLLIYVLINSQYFNSINCVYMNCIKGNVSVVTFAGKEEKKKITEDFGGEGFSVFGEEM